MALPRCLTVLSGVGFITQHVVRLINTRTADRNHNANSSLLTIRTYMSYTCSQKRPMLTMVAVSHWWAAEANHCLAFLHHLTAAVPHTRLTQVGQDAEQFSTAASRRITKGQ